MLLYAASADAGIHVAHFESATGQLSSSREAAAGGFFFLAHHPSGRVLYAAGMKTGRVSAFAIQGDGGLKLLCEADSGGAVPCHLSVDPQGRFLAVANYNGGTTLFSLGDDGTIGEGSFAVQLEGSGVDRRRQEKSHPHGVTFSPDGGLLHVTDLGADRIRAFKIEGGQLREEAGLHARVAPGAGPRHTVFSPDGHVAITVNELGNTLSLFSRNRQTGRLENRRDYTTLSEGFEGKSYAAEVAIHPSGKVCYATNRGEDSVMTYTVDEAASELRAPSWLKQAGAKEPQHVVCDPAGKWLAVSWRTTDEVSLYPLDPATHRASKKSAALHISKPMCAIFVPSAD